MTGYLADAKELHTTLSWYRDRTNGDMAAILRAGPPDSASTHKHWRPNWQLRRSPRLALRNNELSQALVDLGAEQPRRSTENLKGCFPFGRAVPSILGLSAGQARQACVVGAQRA